MKAKAKKQVSNKSLIAKSIIVGCVLAVLFALIAVTKSQYASEFVAKYWSENFARAGQVLFGWLPFSVFEWGAFFLALYLVFVVVAGIVFLCKKQGKRALSLSLNLVLIVMSVATIYYSTAGVAYYRKPYAFDLAENKVMTKESVLAVGKEYYKQFEEVANRLAIDENGNSICPYTFDELAAKISPDSSRIKKVSFSWLMSQFNVMGITFVPTGEANINKNMPSTCLAQTMAHELAHTNCIMDESQANNFAYQTLLASDDDYIRYCGFLATNRYMREMLILSGNKEFQKTIKLPFVVTKDVSREYYFWEENQAFAPIGEFFNNMYLKLSGQGGTNSYYDPNQGEQNGKDENGDIIYVNVIYSTHNRLLFKMFA
ncbi:MAG: DUF3810 family protein [Clostridia bacterium]